MKYDEKTLTVQCQQDNMTICRSFDIMKHNYTYLQTIINKGQIVVANTYRHILGSHHVQIQPVGTIAKVLQ